MTIESEIWWVRWPGSLLADVMSMEGVPTCCSHCASCSLPHSSGCCQHLNLPWFLGLLSSGCHGCFVSTWLPGLSILSPSLDVLFPLALSFPSRLHHSLSPAFNWVPVHPGWFGILTLFALTIIWKLESGEPDCCHRVLAGSPTSAPFPPV